MKSIFDNASYKAATAQLNQLTTAHAAAVADEAGLLSQLSDQPGAKPSALDRAKAMLMGGTPAPRQDRDGLSERLNACRETLALLALAIGEQRAIMGGIAGAQSALINGERKADHIKAAQGIKNALAGLRDAMQVEHSLRAEITGSGYQCSLEPLIHPELNFDDTQSAASRFAADAYSYLARHELGEQKSVNVRMLVGRGDGLSGDVITMTGIEAAALMRAGHAEQTRDKPSRVARPVVESYGMTMATALG